MQFNGESTHQDLYHDALYLAGVTSNDYGIEDFTRNANFALDRVHTLILKADGWTVFDDTNNAGALLDTSQTFASGAQRISLQSTWFKIGRVRITDSGGNYITLPEVPRPALTDSQLTAPSGIPSSYFRLGNYIYFDKPASYGGTVEVQLQRGPSYFTTTDTTKTPGFNAMFHRLISLHAANDHCVTNDMPRAASLQARIGFPPDTQSGQAGAGMEKELMDFYTMRDTDRAISISLKKTDYGERGLSPGTGTYPTNLDPHGF